MSAMGKREKSMEDDNDPNDKGHNAPNDSHESDTAGFISPEEERAVVRKIDSVILPFLCFVFLLQYLDKQSLSYAAVSVSVREFVHGANTFRYLVSSTT